MNPVAVGTRVRVIKNKFNHSYTIGHSYKITHIDDDGTFRAADESGRVGNWLRWEECEPAGPNIWSRIAAELPEDLVRFLACFDGIADITLKGPVVDAILATVPDLHERLVAAVGTPDGRALVEANMPRHPEEPSKGTAS